MLTAWRKVENENGFPYYYNENTHTRRWDHPQFSEIKQSLDDCNYIKYAKYRVALKFRVLQKALFMNDIKLDTVIGVFSKHQLGINESSFSLENYDLEAVLFDIYFAANKQNNNDIDVDYAVDLMQTFLYNIYDKERLVKIQVLSAKLVLALLSDCRLFDIFNYIFTLCADHNNCVTRLRLQFFLNKLVEILTFLHEDVCFGQHLINTTIEDCFSGSPGLVGICENSFLSWLKEIPQLFSWIPVLHRIKSCELTIHNIKCSTCKINPLMGLVYRCMKCSKYTQCQQCFFTGRFNSSHKLSHSVRECYTDESGLRDTTLNFIKKFCGLMPCSTRMGQSDNSSVESKSLIYEKDLLKPAHTENLYCNNESLSSPHTHLQHIIKQLELQNRELQRILLFDTHNEKLIRKYLAEHKVEVATQIHKLKILKEYLHMNFQLPSEKMLISTPIVKDINSYSKPSYFKDMLSPIIQIPEQLDNKKNTNQEPLFSLNRDQDSKEDLTPCTMNDISTWIKDQPTNSKEKGILERKSPVVELHNDLDEALLQLQQILANNFTLDESLGNLDNNHLKNAVSEMEDMLTTFIDTVESSRANSVQPFIQ